MTILADFLADQGFNVAPPPTEPPDDGEYPYTERQRAWLHELETTDLPQARGCLRRPDGFCCLGLYLNWRDPDQWADEPDSRGRFVWGGKSVSRMGMALPDEERIGLGLRGAGGPFLFKNLSPADRELMEAEYKEHHRSAPAPIPDQWALANLNDTGWPFAKIAAFIRRNPAAVFMNTDPKPEKAKS